MYVFKLSFQNQSEKGYGMLYIVGKIWFYVDKVLCSLQIILISFIRFYYTKISNREQQLSFATKFEFRIISKHQ